MIRIRSQREITLTDNLFAGRESFDFDEIFFVRPSLELSIQAALKTLCVEDDFSITKNKSGSWLILPAWSHNYRKQIIIYWLLFSGVCLYVKELDAKIKELTAQMQLASKLLEFEHAAFLRDKIKELKGEIK